MNIAAVCGLYMYDKAEMIVAFINNCQITCARANNICINTPDLETSALCCIQLGYIVSACSAVRPIQLWSSL